ncbi:MAG: radical SAM family heme chaperone HemW [Brevinematales bacterium]|nr:radical SAM family heme chaperone HemW [Brevinematales bacterium]
MQAGFYIHIPFCRKKCNYCGFFSGFKPEKDLLDKYTDYICKEILYYKEKGFFPLTIYIGGGTPSLLSNKNIEKISETFLKNFNITDLEFTIEANPEDVTYEKAKCWFDIGINRVSLGFESMNDTILKFLGRSNSQITNKKSYEILREIGFNNISIDFISSIMGNDTEELINSIDSFEAEHYSIYSLTLDENTKLYNDYKKNLFTPKSDFDYSKDLNIIRKHLMKKGYIHYEVSNFAKSKKYFSIHNTNYWNYSPYIGIGMGSVGFYYQIENKFKGYRFTNFKNFRDYFESINKGLLPIFETEEIELEKATLEFTMLGLRKMSGIDLKNFKKIFKIDFYDYFEKEKINKLEKYLKISENKIALRKNYINVMNTIIPLLWETKR